MPTLMLLSAAGLLLITVLVFRQLLFRLHCHPPLPPGPKGWPVVGCLPLLGAAPPHVALARMAQAHGPIMYLKLGSYGMVIASKPAAVRAFLKTQDRNFSNRPPNAGATHIGYEAQDLVFAAHGPRWTFIRKLSNLHMLGPKSFNDWAPIREAEIGLMIREVYGYGSDRVVPLPETAICAIANVIGQRSLSRRVFASSAESTEFKEMVVEAMRLSGSFNVGDFIPAVAWMDLQGIEGQMKRLHKKFDKLLTEMIEEHSSTKKDREENPDFLDFVTAAGEYSDGLKLTETHIKAILLNLFVAGTDTSASTVEWAMAEMLKNPAILNEAHKEMDRVIGKDRRIREADMSDLPYLKAICKEAFRMHPSVPLSLPRVSSAACEVDGYHIPRGTRLLVNLWAIGRDPEVWKDPAEFKPARFLAGGEGEGIDPMGNDFELTRFGAGRRICVGIRMGIAMVEHLLGALVHGFEWEMPEGVADVDMEERFGLVLQMAVPLRAVARPRLALAAYEI